MTRTGCATTTRSRRSAPDEVASRGRAAGREWDSLGRAAADPRGAPTARRVRPGSNRRGEPGAGLSQGRAPRWGCAPQVGAAPPGGAVRHKRGPCPPSEGRVPPSGGRVPQSHVKYTGEVPIAQCSARSRHGARRTACSRAGSRARWRRIPRLTSSSLATHTAGRSPFVDMMCETVRRPEIAQRCRAPAPPRDRAAPPGASAPGASTATCTSRPHGTRDADRDAPARRTDTPHA